MPKLGILDAIIETIQWLMGYDQRQIGKEQQQNADVKETNSRLQKELAAANNPVSAVDELRSGDF